MLDSQDDLPYTTNEENRLSALIYQGRLSGKDQKCEVCSEVISITQVGKNKNDITDASSVQQIQSEMNRALFLCLMSGISRSKTLC